MTKIKLTESQFEKLKNTILEISRRKAKKSAKKTLATSKDSSQIEKAKETLASLKGQEIESEPVKTDDEVSDIDPANEEFKAKMQIQIMKILQNVKPESGLDIKLANEVISLCCISNEDRIYSFTLVSDTSLEELKGWEKLMVRILGTPDESHLYINNDDVFSTSDNGKTFNMLFNAYSSADTKNILVKNIIDLEPTPTCKVLETPEEQSDELINKGKKALQVILDDPELKAAFYKQPSLWNLFMAELKGKQAPGKGIVPTLQMIGTYIRKKLNDELGAEFRPKKKVKFNVLTPISIEYRGDKKTHAPFTLDAGTNYVINVKDYTIGDDQTVLLDSSRKYKIIIKNKTETPDVYNCDIVKYVETRKGVIDYPVRDVKVRFLTDDKQYDGYLPKETPKNK